MNKVNWQNNVTNLNKATMDTFQDNIEDAIDEKLDKTGGTISGNLIPDTTNTRNLGSDTKQFNFAYVKQIKYNNGNAIGFSWTPTGKFLAHIDNETRGIPVLAGHAIRLVWDENGLGVSIDDTFIGYITFHQI